MDGGFRTVEEYVESLNGRAEVQVEPHKPLKWYARSADLVFKQVPWEDVCRWVNDDDVALRRPVFIRARMITKRHMSCF
jgi:hypothetical protein